MNEAHELLRRALYELSWLESPALVDDIHTYLANQETAKDEAVAWLHCQGNYEEPSFRQLTDEEIKRAWTQKPLYLHPAKPDRKPMTEDAENEAFNSASKYAAWLETENRMLREARKPMTEEEILEAARDHYNPYQRAEISFARAIEKHHGITGEI